MPFPFGTGELATRIRRALDARGRIPLTFDEVVVPTFQVVDATRAPFRFSGRRAQTALFQAAVAGQFARYILSNPTPIDQVLQRIIPFSAGAATTVGAIGIGPGPTSGLPLWTTEGVDAHTQLIAATGLVLNSTTVAATTIAQTLYQFAVAPSGAATGQSLIDLDNLELVVPSGGALTIELFAVNTDARLTVVCQYYDDVGRQGV